MATLLLRLEGPMQSWGTRSRFDVRDTEMEPTKSGVLGLLCAALGVAREDWASLQRLTELKMGVRVDSAGLLRKDYQTAQLSPHRKKSKTALTDKYYLSGASFLVGLEGHDRTLLERVHQSLRNPFYPLCLGRRAFPPSRPVFVGDGVVDLSLLDALKRVQPPSCAEEASKSFRFVMESSDAASGSMRQDVPIDSFAARRFGSRFVVTEHHLLEVE